MSDDLVRARWMGNESDLRLDSGGEDLGEEIHLEHGHIYTLPRSVVEDREDFKVQKEDDDQPADEERPKRTSPPDTSRKREARETAVDKSDREEG